MRMMHSVNKVRMKRRYGEDHLDDVNLGAQEENRRCGGSDQMLQMKQA